MSNKRYFSFTKPEDKAWYLGDFFENSHLVTSENYNPALGIESIAILEPNTKEDNAILANVQVNTVACSFNGTIFLAKNGRDLTFSPQTRKVVQTINGREETRQIPMVNVKQAVIAQILRLAESKHRLAEPVDWETKPATQTNTINPADLTPEQIQALLAQATQAQATQTQTQTQTPASEAVVVTSDLPAGFKAK